MIDKGSEKTEDKPDKLKIKNNIFFKKLNYYFLLNIK
jgi:hypothetical protein